MSAPTDDHQIMLRDYANGRLGTRDAIEKLGAQDYADLLIALARYDLPLPKPADTPRRLASIERARALLLPRLRRAG
jgi:hypothetical protein